MAEHPDWEVIVYERNESVSFLSCGIALWVSDRVSNPDKMFYASPESMTELGATMKMAHEVNSVDVNAKTLVVTDLKTGQQTTEKFDKIVATTGSKPVIPPIEGIDNSCVMLCKNWDDAKKLKENVDSVKSVAVIGSGYIGAELAEGYAVLGKDVTLIDALPHVLGKNFDENISVYAEKMYEKNNVKLGLNEKVVGFSGTDKITVKTDKNSYTVDLAILCIGFKPNTDLFKDQLDMLPNGAIITDEYMQTSAPDVYAAGDATTVLYNPTGKTDYIPLATNAVRQGMLVGKNIEAPNMKYMGTQASSAVNLFDITYASSGLTQAGAKVRGLDVALTTLTQDYRPEFMLSTTPVTMNLIWDPATRRVLGGAFVSEYDVAQSANVMSLAIQNKMTIDELAMVDMFFQPNYDQPINYVNALAMQAVAEAK